jgi:hypothetical protein
MNVRQAQHDEMLRLSTELNEGLTEVQTIDAAETENLEELIVLNEATKQPMIVASNGRDRVGKVLEQKYYQDLLLFNNKSDTDRMTQKRPTRKLMTAIETSTENKRFAKT